MGSATGAQQFPVATTGYIERFATLIGIAKVNKKNRENTYFVSASFRYGARSFFVWGFGFSHSRSELLYVRYIAFREGSA